MICKSSGRRENAGNIGLRDMNKNILTWFKNGDIFKRLATVFFLCVSFYLFTAWGAGREYKFIATGNIPHCL